MTVLTDLILDVLSVERGFLSGSPEEGARILAKAQAIIDSIKLSKELKAKFINTLPATITATVRDIVVGHLFKKIDLVLKANYLISTSPHTDGATPIEILRFYAQELPGITTLIILKLLKANPLGNFKDHLLAIAATVPYFQIPKCAETETELSIAILLKIQMPLECLRNFDVDFLRAAWAISPRKNLETAAVFDAKLIMSGRTPLELGINCERANERLLAIAASAHARCITAMIILVSEHKFRLPDSAIGTFNEMIYRLWHTSDLDPDAAFAVASFYQLGIFGVSNVEEAAKWYEKAVALNHQFSIVNLAMMYELGEIGCLEDGSANEEQAERLYTIAASQFNDAIAEQRLEAISNRRCVRSATETLGL